MGNPVVTVIAAAVFVPSFSIGLWAKIKNRYVEQNIFFPIALLSGFVLNNENGTTTMSFGVINENDAKKLKVNNLEQKIYNSELDEVQSISQTISKELLAKYSKEPKINLEQVVKEGHEKFNAICSQGQLSSETCKVINAIRNQK